MSGTARRRSSRRFWRRARRRPRTWPTVAKAADIVILCVTDVKAVEHVVFGPEGVVEGTGRAPDKLLLDCSSIPPDRTQVFAERLRDETGMGWIDAPVSGGVPGAQAGTLAVYCGGSEAGHGAGAAGVRVLRRECDPYGPERRRSDDQAVQPAHRRHEYGDHRRGDLARPPQRHRCREAAGGLQGRLRGFDPAAGFRPHDDPSRPQDRRDLDPC